MIGAAGIALFAAGVGGALATGAGWAVLLAGLLCGAGMVLLALAWRSERDLPETTPEDAATAATGLSSDDVLDAVDDPILVIEGRRVTRANPAALAVLGPHVVDEDVRLAIRHPAAAEFLARGALDAAGSVDIVGLGGGDRHWTLRVQPMGPDTRLIRMIDRTDGRAAEKMRTDFVANASHELRTPLASLIGFIETLEDANGPADAAIRARFLTIMAGEARRMQRLVDDLISLSRIEADRHRAPAEAGALQSLAGETADAFGADRQRLRIVADDDLPPVAGDHAQLSQLLHNLIGNALKYGDPAKPVRISLSSDSGGMVRLAVADEGEGIAPQHLPRLTERFYRADPGRSRAVGGTGLGLAIVKHIVERHRGRLDIASIPGEGTCVTVLLPATRAVDPPLAATGT